MTMITILLSAGRWLIGSTTGRILLGGVVFFVWLSIHDARLETRIRNEIEAEQKAAAVKRISEMEKSNAAFRNSSAHDRCIAILRDSGLSEDNCDGL